ncbi:hypothetical protein ABFS82_08G001700 [Erythranthe guttata]
MHGEQARLSSISRRTRSKWDDFYKTRHNEIKKKPQQHHEDDDIIINKVALVENIDDSTSNEEEDDDGDFGDTDYKGANARKHNKHAVAVVVEKKSKGGTRRQVKRKAGSFIARGEKVDLTDILVDSLWKQNMQDLVIKQDPKPVSQCSLLPLKFKFEDDQDSFTHEKTDHDREIDSLFHDLEMGLWESQIGCTNSNSNPSISDDEYSISMDESRAARCGRGDHDAFLDEQIGIICSYCSSLLLEIKHVLPPFYVESPEKRARKRYSEEESNNEKMHFANLESSSCTIHHSEKGGSNSSSSSSSTVMDLIPDADKKQLYPHQLQGLEFLWRNIAGDIHINNMATLPANGGRGCIISHAPGTGKTRLTIVFLQTFMKLYPNCLPVIIAPRGMLLTWEQEFAKWNVDIKFHNLNETKLSTQEMEIASTLTDHQSGHEKNNNNNKDYIRFVKLFAWMKGGSVLGVGYRLFEELAGEKHDKNNNKFKKILLESPGLLVLDEGHTPRNNQSLMWKALTRTSTHRRIILSGTPFQNNFTELYNTLCLVNPTFSQQITKATNRGRKQKVANAVKDEWACLTNSISKKNDERVKELRSMIEPFVHIHKGDILEKTLPGMRDCMIVLRPTDVQKKLADKIDQVLVDKFLEHDYLASLISVHPSLVADRPEFSDQKRKLKSLELDPLAGVKTRFLVKLIELSIRVQEKVLVFSEYIDPLQQIKKLIKDYFCWHEGREVIYMDGNLESKQRQVVINSFNDKKSEAKVLLASQRACSEGINLVGASRLVLLDVAWNPSVERQAICRAYRIGQEKMVYVYHLLTLMEVNKYVRQAEKDRISQLIFGHQGGGGGNELVSEDKLLEAMVRHEEKSVVDNNNNNISMFERIVHQPKESDFINTFGFVDLN